MVKKYRKVPAIVEAIQWDGHNRDEIMEFAHGQVIFKYTRIDDRKVYGPLTVQTYEGLMIAHKGDYIIKGVAGEIYPCREEVFEKSFYELTDDEE